MAINLTKGTGINLSKDKGLNKILFTIQWDSDVDMDIHAAVLSNGKAIDEKDFVFFNNLKHPTGCVTHSGDVTNGKNVLGTEDEIITVDLAKLATALPNRDEVLLTAEIYKGAEQGIDFSDIGETTCKIINADTKEELASYRLDIDLAGEVSAVVANVKKDSNGEWHFNAVGQGKPSLVSILGEIGLA